MSDSSELAVASAALVIAVFAAITAIAQAAQQYLLTGQLIRLCDSVVFGLLPGQGRRIWEWSQFRFRIVYDLPLFGIDPDLWPASAAPTFTGAEAGKRAIRAEERKTLGWRLATRSQNGKDSDKDDRRALAKPYVGEASWASFCRTIHPSCYDSLLFWFFEGDADRCPSDLPTVPMPVSLRDTAVMALMTGMECTAASFSRGSISMRGEAGTITSATHPILGSILHYTPPLKVTDHFISHTARIYKDWLWRTMDNCVVAGVHYNARGRMDVEIKRGTFVRMEVVYKAISRYRRESRLAERRQKPIRLEINKSGPELDENEGGSKRPSSQSRTKRDGAWHFLPRPPSGISYEDTRPNLHSQPDFAVLKASMPRDGRPKSPRKHRPRRRHPDLPHDWEVGTERLWEMPPHPNRPYPSEPWETGDPGQAHDARWESREEKRPRGKYRPVPGLSGSSLGLESGPEKSRSEHEDEAKESHYKLEDELQAEGSRSKHEYQREVEESHSAADDESHPEERRLEREAEGGPFQRGDDPHTEERRLKRKEDSSDDESRPEHEGEHEASERHPASEDDDGPGITLAQLQQYEKQLAEEKKLYDWREKLRRLEIQGESEPLGHIKWFWLSQTDILPGYWATPWQSFESLTYAACVGAVHVLIDAVVEKLGAGGIDFEPYLDSSLGHALAGTIEWMRQGKTTYPAYAYEADGGIVCSGGYAEYKPPVDGPALFSSRIPAVPLLDSVSHQTSSAENKSKTHSERRLLELMRLDAWLSLVGRTPEITSGSTELLVFAPALVQKLIDHFGRDFVQLYVDSQGVGGAREMSSVIARDLLRFLGRECEEGAEVVYAVVAALRAVKVGICVLAGADTSILGEIFEKDVLVYLV